jgi:hypothetical protein
VKQRDSNDRHGFRGTPPPASFSLAELPDDVLLTEYETAAVGRWSTNSLAAWRRQPGHPLKWELAAGRFVRYRAGDLKHYIATPSKRRGRGPSKRRPEQSSASEIGTRSAQREST